MRKRIDKSWLVVISIENSDHDRCLDLFLRPDGTYGFEEFRRDMEDRGEWTPASYYSDSIYPTAASALRVASQSIVWSQDAIMQSVSAQRLLSKGKD